MAQHQNSTEAKRCRTTKRRSSAPVQPVVRPRGETEVKIAAKLYEARDSMRLLCRDAFQERISPYRTWLTEYAGANHCTIVQASMQGLQRMQANGADGLSQALLLAAAVEIVEPSA